MEVLQTGKRNRAPEKQERRAKIRELQRLSSVSGMENIQDLFVAAWMEHVEMIRRFIQRYIFERPTPLPGQILVSKIPLFRLV